MLPPLHSTSVASDPQRDKLLQKLVEVEMDSHAAMRQCEALKAALAKLQRVSDGCEEVCSDRCEEVCSDRCEEVCSDR